MTIYALDIPLGTGRLRVWHNQNMLHLRIIEQFICGEKKREKIFLLEKINA